jgi:hypothetical protein
MWKVTSSRHASPRNMCVALHVACRPLRRSHRDAVPDRKERGIETDPCRLTAITSWGNLLRR